MIYQGLMTRLSLLLVFASACDVGTVLANTAPDGGGSGVDCPTGLTPLTPHMHTAGGTSNPGMACIVAGCHADTSKGQSVYNYAGTVYDPTGATGVGGIDVLVTLGGVTKKALTDSDGNFYIEDPILAAPSALMSASTKVCNGPTPMVGVLVAGQGSCNQTGTCHGGTQGKMHSP
jgi:hypothetical protein